MKKIFISIAVLTGANSLFAQDTLQTLLLLPPKIELAEVLISANALAWDNSPFSFLDLKQDALDAKNIGQEPSFLLSETPAITAYSDAGSGQGYSYIRMRGIDQTRINMTFDGMPLNEPEDQGSYFSNYPDLLNSVQKIQVQRGTGPSKNGSASYAGSIQLLSASMHEPQKATFGMGYGWFNSYRAFAEYNTGIQRNKGLYARVSYLKSDGYKYRSGNTSQSAYLSGYLLAPKSTWKLISFVGRQQNQLAWLGVADSLVALDPRTNANSNEDDDFLQAFVLGQNAWRIKDNLLLRSSVYYSHLNGGYDFDLNNFLGLPSTNEMYHYAFKSHFVGGMTNLTYYSYHGWYLTAGVHGNLYNRRHTGSERTLGQLYQNTGYKNEFSAFTKYNHQLGKWTLLLDLQYRMVSFDYAGSVQFEKRNWTFFNPQAGISYEASEGVHVYYSAGMTGREPTRNDMFGGGDDLLADSTGQALLAITDAERVIDQELGFRVGKNRWALSVNAYYMDFYDEIVLNGKFGPNGLALTNNVDRSFRTGLECSVNWKVTDHFSLVNHSSFNYSRIKEQSEVFSPILSPMVIVNQELIYDTKSWGAALSCRYQSSSYMDFANSASLDGYFLLNARLAYKVRQFTFALFANNLLGTKYFNNGYVDYDGSRKYFVQAPFNFYGNVTFSF